MSDFASSFEAFNAQMNAETTQAVKIWKNWMTLIFLASLIFVWKYKAARVALLALLFTAIGAVLCWLAFQNVHLLGIVHFVVWLPLAIYLWKRVLSPSARAAYAEGGLDKIFLIWMALLILTIIISLVFDARDIFLVMTGVKTV